MAARLTGFKIDIKSETQAREAGDFMDYESDYEDYDEEDYADDEYADDGYAEEGYADDEYADEYEEDVEFYEEGAKEGYENE